ncbi:MAG TPA: DUF4230 domain-containing protein [Longimicrobiales bacterium]|nr:DUF4230 domain-containing protein [Longimicrobiales bacterium]
MSEPVLPRDDRDPAERDQEPAARSRWWGTVGCVLVPLVLIVAVVAGLLTLLQRRPRLTETTARQLVTTTLQRESREAFVVTGTLEIATTTRVRSTTRLLPGILDVSLGTTQSTVRVPGRVSYGVAIPELDARAIRVYGDTVELQLPPPAVYAVEPILDQMEVRTESGWLEVRGSAREEVERRAIALIRGAMRAQAERHLQDSDQPAINTAEALHELLRPVFQSAGLRNPVFRFRLTEALTYTADRPRRR